MRWAWLLVLAVAALAHDGHGKKTAPASAKALRNPLTGAQAQATAGKAAYERLCASCHGNDGLAKGGAAKKPRPTNLTDHRMDSMADGEIYWVITHGIKGTMPAFQSQASDMERWQVVLYVRHLRKPQAHAGGH